VSLVVVVNLIGMSTTAMGFNS